MTPTQLELLVALVAHERVPALRGQPVLRDELLVITGRAPGGAVSRALAELECLGLVEVSRPRAMNSGRVPFAYRVTPAGEAAVLQLQQEGEAA